MAAYISKADLDNALGVNIIIGIFDDDNDGNVDQEPLNACLNFASAQVDGFLAGTYDIALPIASPPTIVKVAAIDFACAYATRRRPDVVRAMGEEPWTKFQDMAERSMKQFASALKRLPSASGAPSNVGSLTTDNSSRICIDNTDGTSNMGDF